MSARRGGPLSGLLVGLARAWLRVGLRGSDREFLRGDLEESWTARRRRDGDGAAARWYLAQAMRSAWRRRVAGSPMGPGQARGERAGRLEELGRDGRFAMRVLGADPLFALSAILMLGLGVGGTTSMFTFVNALLLKPLPYTEGERLVELQEVSLTGELWPVDWYNFRDWRERATAFESMAAFYATSFNALDGDEPVRVSGLRVDAALFDVLRARPALGRTFAPGEDAAGAPPVAIVADSFWRRVLGADPAVLGKALRLHGVPHTIVGVMPPGFHFREYAEVWVPHGLDADRLPRGSHYWRVVARLRPGVDVAAARAEMDRLGRGLAAEYPESNSGRTATALALREAIVGESGSQALIFLAVVVLVQMIATVNVGNLMLSRSLGRRREMAIRAAVGAGRGRLVRQLLTESLILAAVGGAVGLALGLRGRTWILDSVPVDVPRWFDFAVDYRVVLFSAFTSAAAGVVFGLAPALFASRDVTAALRDGDRGAAGEPRLRGLLVVAEVAITLVLLVGAGLMLKGADRTRRVDPGFDPDGVLTFRVSLPSSDYSADEAIVFFDRLADEAGALPAARSAGAISLLPLSNSMNMAYVWTDGMDLREGERPPLVNHSVIAGDYFETLSVRLLAGRPPAASAGDRREAVVSEDLARRLWPDEPAVGKRLRTGDTDADPWSTVVGVASGVRHLSLRAEGTTETLYVPQAHAPRHAMSVVVGTEGDPLDLVDAAREVVRRFDPYLPVFDVRTMERVVTDSMWQSSLFSWMFGVFAALGLALATVGLYGLVAYGVRRQTREIGVRLALGSDRIGVVRLVVGRALLRVAAGVALGLLAALGFSRMIASLMFGVSVLDPTVYGAVTVALLAVGWLAAIAPALRAARVDPLIALRAD